MAIPIHLQKFKAAGIYRVVFDKSTVLNTDTDIVRLVVGYSEKGPFNIPVYVSSISDFKAIYGDISKKLEKRGIFFHRLALQALSTAPILCLNLKKFDGETVSGATISSDFNPTFETIDTVELNVEDIYDTTRFWSLSPEKLNDLKAVDGTLMDQYINICATDTKKTSASFFIRKASGSKVSNYNITVNDWYGSRDLIPDYLANHTHCKISDFFAEIYVFNGKFTVDQVLASSTLKNYFEVDTNKLDSDGNPILMLKPYVTDAFGDSVDTLDALYDDETSGRVGHYLGALIPYFTDKQGVYQSLDIVFNQSSDDHHMMMNFNIDLLEEDGIANIDISGKDKIVDSGLYHVHTGGSLSAKGVSLDSIFEGKGYTTLLGNVAAPVVTDIISFSNTAIKYSNEEGMIKGNKKVRCTGYVSDYNEDNLTITVTQVGSSEPVYAEETKTGYRVAQKDGKCLFKCVNYDVVQSVNYTQAEIDAAKAVVEAADYVAGSDLDAELVATKTVEDTHKVHPELMPLSDILQYGLENEFKCHTESVDNGDGTYAFVCDYDLTYLANHEGSYYLHAMESYTYVERVLQENDTDRILSISHIGYYLDHYKYDATTGDCLLDEDGNHIPETYTYYTYHSSPNMLVFKSSSAEAWMGDMVKFGAAYTYLAKNTDKEDIENYGSSYIAYAFYDECHGTYYKGEAFNYDDIAKTYSLVGPEKIITNISRVELNTESPSSDSDEDYIDYFDVDNNLKVSKEDVSIITSSKYVDELAYDDGANTHSIYGSSISFIPKSAEWSLVTDFDGSIALVSATENSLISILQAGDCLLSEDGTSDMDEDGLFWNEDGNGDGEIDRDPDDKPNGYFDTVFVSETGSKVVATDIETNDVTIEAGTNVYYVKLSHSPLIYSNKSRRGDEEFDVYHNYLVRVDAPINQEIGSMKPYYLEGYTFKNEKPESLGMYGKWKWQQMILSALTDYKGLRTGLLNKAEIDYRYIIDTFESFPEPGCKSILSYLAKEKQSAFAILNFPSAKTFVKCPYTSFTDDKGIFNVNYVVAGYNKKKASSLRFNLPSEYDGASFCAFYTPLKYSDGYVDTIVPSAGVVSNLFVEKYLSRQPYYIIAGPNYGSITGSGLVGPDYKYSQEELNIIEPYGVNCMVYRPNFGTFINANQTAKQTPKSALSSVNVRELVIYLQDEIEKVLQSYQWEFNNTTTRNAILDKANSICARIQANGGIQAYLNVMDESNNTAEIIDNEMAILDTHIEPGRGCGKMVHQLTLYSTGKMSSSIKD